jgi:hypothetical protein
MKLHCLEFHGGLLERGFWLYVWRVRHNSDCVLYVGRTGDSSSRFASSPFSRLGQHLDVRVNATANMLLRNIRAIGFDPQQCSFELFSYGPLFPEQPDLLLHRRHRDIVGPLETALAEHLKGSGHRVLGKHPKVRSFDGALFDEVRTHIDGALKQ